MINQTAFHIMAKPTGPICNMDCAYCFYLEKENLYPSHKIWRMNNEVLESFVKQYIEAQKVPIVNFTWQGGEPTLLSLDFFKEATFLQNKYAFGKTVNNAFQTNGILLNDDWCDFFAQNNFLIGLSIDGPEHIQNKYRYLKGGQPSFEKVIKAVELLKKYKVKFNTLTCVNKYNSYHALEVYNFLKEVGSGYMQFIPIVERKADLHENNSTLLSPNLKQKAVLTEWSVEFLQYGKFLAEIFDEWVRKDVGKYFVQMFDVALESWYGISHSLCIFNEICGGAMAIEHNGDLYSCDHYVYPENKLGNIVEENISKLVSKKEQQIFGEYKKTNLPKYCFECEFRFACNGECPKNRFVKTPDGEVGLNYLCEGYKYFFNHINVYMLFMSNELKHHRAPANVMKWVKEKDRGFPSFNVGRNDFCPCGSSKKYKNCCFVYRKSCFIKKSCRNGKNIFLGVLT